MIKKIIISLCLLVTQVLVLNPSQAANGYTSWNDYMRKYNSCNMERVECGSFTYGQPVYFIVYSICAYKGNECMSVTNYTRYSNDPYELLSILINSINTIKGITGGDLASFEPLFIDYAGLNYNSFIVRPNEKIFTGVPIIANIHVPICSGYIEGYGCPNTNNNNTPPGEDVLDRTKIADAPCETCSKLGNPFDVRNGAKTESATDLDFPLIVQRLYYSKMKNPGMFGTNWRSNFDKSVKITKDTNKNITTLVFITPDDQEIIYTTPAGGALTAAYNDSSQSQITVGTNDIKLVRPDSGIEMYDIKTGQIISETYKGKTLSYQYSGNLLNKVTDSLGRYLQMNYSGSTSFISSITASNGDILIYTYDTGNVATVKLNNMAQITYEYYNNLLTGKRDSNNIKYASFTYDEKGRGIENKWITNDGHDVKKYTFNYGTDSTTVTQDNGFSRVYNMATMNYGKKIVSLNNNGFTESNSFDSDGNVTQKKDFNNVYETYTYDTAGRIVTSAKAGKNVTINWDTTNNVINSMEENSANGTRTTSYTYDSNFNVLQKTVAGSVSGETMVWNYTYTTAGRIATEIAPNGLITTYNYKPTNTTAISGLLHSITTNSGQNIVINTYDTKGNPTAITVNGVTKTMTYDYKGRVLTESTVNGSNNITNTYTYDNNGNMLTSLMASGYQLNMTYDTAGRLLAISDNMGGSSTFGIDDYTGEVLNTQINQNNTLVRARNKIIDTLGRTTSSWNATDKTKQLTNYYNYIDKPNSTTDANGSQTNYGWDNRNNMLTYNGGGDSSSQTYDIDNNQTRMTVNNQETTMNYDDFGRIVQLNSADTGTHNYAYNTTNRTVSHTDAKGITHTSNSDLNGNPTTITHTSVANQTENYGYNTKGQLTSFNDNSGNTSYVRNNLGQITIKTQNIGTKAFTVTYGYNTLGQKITDTYPSGMVVNYSYTNGFLTGINAGGATIVDSVTYNTMLQEPVSWNLGGNTVSINKDTDGLLTSFIDNGILNQSITTDNEGHVTAVNDNSSNNNFEVKLKNNYALESGTMNGNTLFYYFGYNDNLYIQKDGITNFNFGASYYNNKVLNFDNTVVAFTNQYDLNGNTTSDNKGSYTYDLKNNMISSTRMLNGVTSNGAYTFNALNHRVSKNVGGQVKYFAYNESNQVIGEYDSSGNIISEYIYFGLRPVAVKAGGSLNIVHTDYLTTPRVITSSNGGSIVWQWKNDNPYGNNEAQGTLEFNLRFAGQYYDSESGLHYNIHRTYNPEMGRYMQSDPLGLDGGFNTYNYAGRNPLNSVDPDGLYWQYVIPTAVGALTGGAIGGIMNYNKPTGFWKGFGEGAVTGAITGLSISGAGRLIGAVLGEGALTQIGANVTGSLAGEYSRQKLFHSCEETNIDNLLFAGFNGAVFSPLLKPYILGKQNVVSWAGQGITPDLTSGRWVMSGFDNIRNFGLSGIFARSYPKTNVIQGTVDGAKLTYPIGREAKLWEITKGLFGQRMIK